MPVVPLSPPEPLPDDVPEEPLEPLVPPELPLPLPLPLPPLPEPFDVPPSFVGVSLPVLAPGEEPHCAARSAESVKETAGTMERLSMDLGLWRSRSDNRRFMKEVPRRRVTRERGKCSQFVG
jgi:hypothetical protein